MMVGYFKIVFSLLVPIVSSRTANSVTLPLAPPWSTAENNTATGCVGRANIEQDGFFIQFAKIDRRLVMSFKVLNTSEVRHRSPEFDKCFVPEALWTWHIHQRSGIASNLGFGSTTCSDYSVGGHWDPTLACGPSSDNLLCKRFPIPPSSGIPEPLQRMLRKYTCDPNTYTQATYACELGDLSGKYFPLVVPPPDENGDLELAVGIYDPHDVVPSCELEGKTLVVHCGTERLFCFKLRLQHEPISSFYDTVESHTEATELYQTFLKKYLDTNGAARF